MEADRKAKLAEHNYWDELWPCATSSVCSAARAWRSSSRAACRRSTTRVDALVPAPCNQGHRAQHASLLRAGNPKRSIRLKFQGGQVIMILDGSGYTLVDGVKHPWEAGDVLNLPLRAKGIIVQHFNTDPVKPARFRRRRAELGRMHLCRSRLAASSSSKMHPNTGADAMDDLTHQHHGAHGHGGRLHVHASVDHLANELGTSARLAIRLDAALMAEARRRRRRHRAGRDRARPQHPGAARPALDSDLTPAIVRLDRFVRQALKAHLNESVEIETADVGTGQAHRAQPGRRRLDGARPGAAHQEGAVENKTPASVGAVLYVAVPEFLCRDDLRGAQGLRRPGRGRRNHRGRAQLSRLPRARWRLRHHLRGRRRPGPSRSS